MAISYKKLWKLLIDKDMKKKDLQQLAGISAASITRLGKNENVNTEIIEKICIAIINLTDGSGELKIYHHPNILERKGNLYG